MIIVTGGAGFIGSNIVKGLNKIGIEEILIVDDLKQSEKHRNLSPLTFTDYADYRDFIENLEHYTENCTAIFHQGACSDTTEKDGHFMMETNFHYSRKLVNFALSKKIEFLYASSASVYGNGDKGFTEQQACENPLNVYAFSKFVFDNYVRNLLKRGKPESQITGLRYFNVYGPNEDHKGRMASVVNHFYHQAKKENQIKIFAGSQQFLRDFIYVDDVVDVNLFFYHNKHSGIYNCGTGKPRSFYDIAEIVQKSLDRPEIQEIPFPDDLKGKYQTFTQADVKKLRAAGYDKKYYTLEEGVEAYLKILKKDH